MLTLVLRRNRVKFPKTSFVAGVLPLCLLAVLAASPATAGTITVQPVSQTITGSMSFSVDIAITGAADLYGYQFDIGFDPTVLSAVAVTEGSFLSSGGPTFFSPGDIDNVAGSISFILDALIGPLPGVSGDGILATVHFSSIGNGTSPVTVFNVIALDSSLSGTVDQILNGSVTVNDIGAVPEPAGMGLIGVVLVGAAVAWRSRRRRC
jgi:hypothetical protein